MTNESTNNYNDWSNSDINHAVARSVDGLHNYKNTAVDCYVVGIVREQVRVWSEDDGEWYSKNYCTNPSGAWPILIEYNIGVAKYENEDLWFEIQDKLRFDQIPEDKNPLRAAMICYLMLMDLRVKLDEK
jgi:Protein of unknown function (DUF2591)